MIKLTKTTKITRQEEEAFFGKSPAPVFDGGEKIAAEIAETNRLINEAEAFLEAEDPGLLKVQDIDGVFFELLSAWKARKGN